MKCLVPFTEFSNSAVFDRTFQAVLNASIIGLREDFSVVQIILYIVLGLVTGVLSGFVGIGGGIIIIPALVLLFGLTQAQAQGTTIALLVLPIGILAAWNYYAAGLVNFKIVAFVAIGFFIGGFIGSKFAVQVQTEVLQKIFGVVLLVIGAYMIVKK